MQMINYTSWIIVALLGISLIACERKEPNLDPTDLVDERDGQRYSTEKYGNQWWMAENLAYNLPESKINPDNPFSEYGRLYNHEQAKMVCPDGWHLPTDRDWQTLERHLGLEAHTLGYTGHRGGNIGGGLKSATGWSLNNGTNVYLFNAYPVGHYNKDLERFENFTQRAEFWTASPSDEPGKAWIRNLTKDFDSIYRGDMPQEDYLSCRCVKNE